MYLLPVYKMAFFQSFRWICFEAILFGIIISYPDIQIKFKEDSSILERCMLHFGKINLVADKFHNLCTVTELFVPNQLGVM